MKILYLAAYESEAKVDEILKLLINTGALITESAVKAMLGSENRISFVDVTVAGIDLSVYDTALLMAVV